MSTRTKWIIGIIVVGALLFLARGAFASTTHEEKANICHLTSSETNPWVAQQINANELQSHLANGDFLYGGKLKDGKPDNKDKQADNWCKNHIPEVTPTPTLTATPTATPSATLTTDNSAVDLCPNFAGFQNPVPQGAAINDKGLCYDLANPTPAPAVASTVKELPATGDNSLFTYLAIALGLIGIGIPASLWATKKINNLKG